MHVATSSVDQLIDYVKNTPADGFTSAASVQKINAIVNSNHAYLKNANQQLQEALVK